MALGQPHITLGADLADMLLMIGFATFSHAIREGPGTSPPLADLLSVLLPLGWPADDLSELADYRYISPPPAPINCLSLVQITPATEDEDPRFFEITFDLTSVLDMYRASLEEDMLTHEEELSAPPRPSRPLPSDIGSPPMQSRAPRPRSSSTRAPSTSTRPAATQGPRLGARLAYEDLAGGESTRGSRQMHPPVGAGRPHRAEPIAHLEPARSSHERSRSPLRRTRIPSQPVSVPPGAPISTLPGGIIPWRAPPLSPAPAGRIMVIPPPRPWTPPRSRPGSQI